MTVCDLCGTAEATVERQIGPLTMAACQACAPRLPQPQGEPEPASAPRKPPQALARAGSDLLGTLTAAAERRMAAELAYQQALRRARRHYGVSALARAARVTRQTIYNQLAKGD